MTTQSSLANAVNLFAGTSPAVPTGFVRILMKTNKYYIDGSLLRTGVEYNLPSAWAEMAIGKQWAADIGDSLPFVGNPATLTAAAQAGLLGQGLSGQGPFAVIAVGNSISQFGCFNNGATKGWPELSEMAVALSLAPIGYWTKRVIPVTGTPAVDLYGNYGYSGQAIPTIVNEMTTRLLPQLVAGAYRPTLVSGVALFDNDIYNQPFSTFAQIPGKTQAFINAARLLAPNAVVHICTPHPDGRIAQQTTAQVLSTKALWAAVREYLLSLDNGYDVFVTDLAAPGGYATPGDLSQPLPGMLLNDGSQVHPNSKGVFRNGRLIAKTFQRITARVTMPNVFRSVNLGMAGSAVSIGSYAAGTGPVVPAAQMPQVVFADGVTTVGTAGNPGPWNLVCTATAANGAVYIQHSSTSVLPSGDSFGWMKVRINSGAKNIGRFWFDSTLVGSTTDTVVSNVEDFLGTASALREYADGDVFYLYTPSRARPASLNTIACTLVFTIQTIGASVDIDVMQMGFVDQSLS